MRIYLVKRTDHVDYDEHGGLVVRAESPEHAARIATEPDNRMPWKEFREEWEHDHADESWSDGRYQSRYYRYASFLPDRSNFKVTEVLKAGEPGVILEDFNAG